MEAPVIQLTKFFNPEGKLKLRFKAEDVNGMLEWFDASGVTEEEAIIHMTTVYDDPVFGTSLEFPSSTRRYEKPVGDMLA